MIELVCTILLSIVALIAGWGQCIKNNRPTKLGLVVFTMVLLLTSVSASVVYISGINETAKQERMIAQIETLENELYFDAEEARLSRTIEDRANYLRYYIHASFYQTTSRSWNGINRYRDELREAYKELFETVDIDIETVKGRDLPFTELNLFMDQIDMTLESIHTISQEANDPNNSAIERLRDTRTYRLMLTVDVYVIRLKKVAAEKYATK